MADLRPAARRAAALALAAALLAACATVRRAREAQDPASAVPGERTPTARELGLAVEGPLALDVATRAALGAHPSIQSARRAEEAAGARVGQAESEFYPQLATNASVQYRNAKNDGIGRTREDHHFESGGFQLSWLLFDFGRTSAFARQAADEWLAAQEERRGAEIDAVHGVRAAYFTLVRQLHLRDVARDAVAQFEEHLAQVAEFVRVGTRIEYDRTKAEVDLGNAKLDLVRAEDAVLLAQAALANSVGIAETTDWVPDDAVRLPEPPATFEVCWEIARKSQPALAAAAARVEASGELVNAQIAALYPQIDLGFGYTAAGSDHPLPWSWQTGTSLSWIPFDGFGNLYSIDEAVAQLRSARAALAATEQGTWLEVRTSWIGTIDARRRLELTSLLVRSADENLRLAQGRFDAGRGTTVELTDARQALTSARADEVQARAELDLATARLWRSLGRTGEEPPEKEPAPAEGKKP